MKRIGTKIIAITMATLSIGIIAGGTSLGVLLSPSTVANQPSFLLDGKSYIREAVIPPKNGNFLKYVLSQSIASTYTLPLFIAAPSEKLYDVLQLPKLAFDIINIGQDGTNNSIRSIFTTPDQGGIPSSTGSYTTLWRFASAGAADFKRERIGNDGISESINATMLSSDDRHMLVALNQDATWFDGTPVKASDFAQTLRYVLDLNTTSELQQVALDTNMTGTAGCVAEQEEYIQKTGLPIEDPFNVDQKTEEERIRVLRETPSCAGFALELNSENSSAVSATDIQKAGIIYNDEFNYIMYNFSTKTDVNDIFGGLNLVSSPLFMPSNKKFIDSIGGIQNFALDKESTIGTGPHKIDEIVYGNLGYAKLSPYEDFFRASTQLTGNIDLFFTQEGTTTYALFEDRKIAKTRVTAEGLTRFSNDPEYRRLLKKQTGIGSFVFNLNIPAEYDENNPISDPDLRRALYYIMNRKEALEIAGWDSTFPITTLSVFSSTASLTSDKLSPEIFQDEEVFDTEAPAEAGGKNIPLRTVSVAEQQTKSSELETINKTDKSFLPEVAKFYLDRYKAKHPGKKSIDLIFLYNTEEIEAQRVNTLFKSLVKEYFGDYINIIDRPVPSNFYEALRASGEYDMTVYTLEPTGTGNLAYYRLFFWPDEITEKKTSGFKSNPSGGFTFSRWFNSLGANEEVTRQRLEIDKDVWEFIKFLVNPQSSLNVDYNESYTGKGFVAWKQRVSEIESLSFTPSTLDRYQNIPEIVKNFKIDDTNIRIMLSIAFEKIVREAVPTIPIMEVDTFWTITRMSGKSEQNLSNVYLYAYICDRPEEKPLAILPDCGEES